MNILYFFCIDPSLGKIDKFSLSQQTLLELFTEKIENKEIICESKDLQDISDWNSLECNDSREITVIRWYSKSLRGSVALEWIPLTVLEVYLYMNQLTGTADLTRLPDGLNTLNIANNKFYGSVDLTKLPKGNRFAVLNLGNNDFEGTIDLTQLPEKMTHLYLDWNNFSGKTDFSQLPKSFKVFTVKHTHLEGEIFDFDGALVLTKSQVKDRRKVTFW